MRLKKSNHAVYKTQYHIVWVTKYRLRILNPGFAAHVKQLLFKAAESIPAVEIEEVNVQKEHVHMLAIIPPRYSVSEIVGKLKGVTLLYMRRYYKWLRRRYEKEEALWSPGYFVSTVGIDEVIIKKYVKYQQSLDSGQATLDL